MSNVWEFTNHCGVQCNMSHKPSNAFPKEHLRGESLRMQIKLVWPFTHQIISHYVIPILSNTKARFPITCDASYLSWVIALAKSLLHKSFLCIYPLHNLRCKYTRFSSLYARLLVTKSSDSITHPISSSCL